MRTPSSALPSPPYGLFDIRGADEVFFNADFFAAALTGGFAAFLLAVLPEAFLAAFAAALLVAGTAFAADPTGNWKWTVSGRDGQTREMTAKLELKDGKLTGTVAGRQGDNPISDASFKDDVVAFSTTGGGGQFVTKYQGKLEGDTITGKSERPGRDGGQVRTNDWKATRVK